MRNGARGGMSLPKLNDFMAAGATGKRELLRARGTVPSPVPRLMNKNETRYELHLRRKQRAGEIAAHAYEAVRLRLAGSTFYTPDFLVLDGDGFLELHEVKVWWKAKKGERGRVGWTEDSRLKIKVAAEQYPFFRFRAAWERAGVWYLEEFGSYGRGEE